MSTIADRIRELERRGWEARDIAEVLDLPIGKVEAEMAGDGICEHGTPKIEECGACIVEAEEEDDRVVVRPCLFEGDHGGLRILESFHLPTMRKTLGENGAIELISALVSKRAFSREAALEIVQDSGLL